MRIVSVARGASVKRISKMSFIRDTGLPFFKRIIDGDQRFGLGVADENFVTFA